MDKIEALNIVINFLDCDSDLRKTMEDIRNDILISKLNEEDNV